MSLLVISDKIHHPIYQILPFEVESLEPHCPYLTCHIKVCYSEIILLDGSFDAGIGLQLLKDIKTMRPDLPVIFITDASSEDMVIKAFKAGAREYFKKPFDAFELRETIINLSKIIKEARERRSSLRENRSYSGKDVAAPISDKPRNILRVIHFIEKNISGELDVARLARKAYLSKFHFCRVFKKCLGMSPAQYVISLRVEKAKRLIDANDSTISQIATEVGFSDLSNFSRHFKRFTGKTPTNYKKQF